MTIETEVEVEIDFDEILDRHLECLSSDEVFTLITYIGDCSSDKMNILLADYYTKRVERATERAKAKWKVREEGYSEDESYDDESAVTDLGRLEKQSTNGPTNPTSLVADSIREAANNEILPMVHSAETNISSTRRRI